MEQEIQPVFDKIVGHLRAQNAKSMIMRPARLGGIIGGEGGWASDAPEKICAYRSKDGLSCAAGCLIPDSEYHSNMEGRTIVGMEFFDNWPANTQQMVSRMQGVHDRNPPEEWEHGFKLVAERYDLVVPAL